MKHFICACWAISAVGLFSLPAIATAQGPISVARTEDYDKSSADIFSYAVKGITAVAVSRPPFTFGDQAIMATFDDIQKFINVAGVATFAHDKIGALPPGTPRLEFTYHQFPPGALVDYRITLKVLEEGFIKRTGKPCYECVAFQDEWNFIGSHGKRADLALCLRFVGKWAAKQLAEANKPSG